MPYDESQQEFQEEQQQVQQYGAVPSPQTSAFLGGAQPVMMQPNQPGVYGYGAANYGYPQPHQLNENMYGYAAKPLRPRGGLNVGMMLGSLFVPWILFVVVYAVESFSLHARNTSAMYAIVWIVFALIMLLGAHTVRSMWSRTGRGDMNWLLFLFATSLVAWIAGLLVGEANFQRNMRPFYDETGLNFYPSVDPAVSEGQQLMDAGRILFTPSAHLDLTKSMGFRNRDMYCVAPIVGTNASASYDFWAVGTNCCAGHASLFQCGEFNNPNAHAGLRLMRDDQRPFFRLAVQEAEAAYNIRANHPIFLTWMADPMLEVHAYEDNGYRYFLLGIFVHFACQLFLVIVGAIAFTKFGNL